ncbi:hypothetical protein HY643_00920 [Candidatus Woesearchaeota archaeon]|nr:hypothetical protein [Candidatus Woesearchaeota archaeon]
MKNKNLAILLAASAASFSLGICSAETIKGLTKPATYLVKEGFYQNPYDLKIIHREVEGKIETYILDTKTKNYAPVMEDFKQQKKDDLKEKIEIFLKLFYFSNFF